MTDSTTASELEKKTAFPAVDSAFDQMSEKPDLTQETKGIKTLEVNVTTTHETKEVKKEVEKKVEKKKNPEVPPLKKLTLQERILMSDDEFSSMTHEEYIQAITELKEKFEQQKELVDFSFTQKLSTPIERIIPDGNDKKQQTKLVDQANNWVKKLTVLEDRNEKELKILKGNKVLKATERKAYIEALNAYIDLETKISARKNGDYPTVDDSTQRSGVNRQKGAVKRGFDDPVDTQNTFKQGKFIIDKKRVKKSLEQDGANFDKEARSKSMDQCDFGEVFQKGGAAGVIRKAMDMTNMSWQSKNNRSALAFIGLLGFGGKKLIDRATDKKQPWYQKLGILAGVAFGAEALTGDNIAVLIKKLMTGGFSMDELNQKFNGMFADADKHAPEISNYMKNQSLLGLIGRDQTMANFLALQGDWSKNPQTYADWRLKNLEMLMSPEMKELRGSDDAIVKQFKTIFPEQYNDEIINNFLGNYGLNAKHLTQEEKNLTAQEVHDRIYNNKIKMENRLNAKGKKINPKGLKNINYYLIHADVSDATREKMDAEGGFFETDLSNNYSIERKDDKTKMIAQVDQLPSLADLSPEKKQEIKNGIIQFYDSMPGDNKPKFNLIEEGGKIYLLSHQTSIGESSQGVEIDLRKKQLPHLVKNDINLDFIKSGYKGLFATAYVSNGIMNITKNQPTSSTTPFEYRGWRNFINLNSGMPLSGQGFYYDNKDLLSGQWGIDTQVLSDGLLGCFSKMKEIAPEIHENPLSYQNYLNWYHNNRKSFVVNPALGSSSETQGNNIQNKGDTSEPLTSPTEDTSTSLTQQKEEKAESNPVEMDPKILIAGLVGLSAAEINQKLTPDQIKIIQKEVGAGVDGKYGPQTDGKVAEYTKNSNKIEPNKEKYLDDLLTNKRYYYAKGREKEVFKAHIEEGKSISDLLADPIDIPSKKVEKMNDKKETSQNDRVKPELPNENADGGVDARYEMRVNTYVIPGLSKDGYFVSTQNVKNPNIDIYYSEKGESFSNGVGGKKIEFSTKKTYNLKKRVDKDGAFDKENFWKYVKIDLKEQLEREKKQGKYQDVRKTLLTQQIPFEKLLKAEEKRNDYQKAFLSQFTRDQFNEKGKISFKNISTLQPTKDNKGWYVDFNFKFNKKNKYTFKDVYSDVYPKFYLNDITNADGTINWQKFYQKVREWVDKLAEK